MVENPGEAAWQDIGFRDSAMPVKYRPGGWQARSYLMIRKLYVVNLQPLELFCRIIARLPDSHCSIERAC